MHAIGVLADAREGAPEGRIDDVARDEPADEQHRQTIDIGGVAEEIEAEEAEDRIDLHAQQAIGPTGHRAPFVGELLQQRRHHQGLHQQGEARRAQHDEARGEADDGGGPGCDDQLAQGLLPAIGGHDPRRIGAHAEESRMAQSHDARKTDQQIQRQGEEDRREDLGAQRMVAIENEIGGERRDPGNRLIPFEAMTAREGVDDRLAVHRGA